MTDSLTFILSTGRCGTQWIARTVADVYADVIDVSHESLGHGYEPRLMLGVSAGVADALPDAVAAHVDQLAARERPYLECGHPCWSAIPFLRDRFGHRMRVIHLARHPVPTSLSWLTHRAYEAPLLPHLDERVLLSPYDAGVRFGEYRDRWDQLSPFEKCVYYWAEVNALALDTERESETQWLRLSYEALFQGHGLAEMLDFLELPAREAAFDARSVLLDEHRYVTLPGHDWRAIDRHPRAVDIAKKLGYGALDVDDAAMQRRYEQGRQGVFPSRS
jgi:hypothetical protein